VLVVHGHDGGDELPSTARVGLRDEQRRTSEYEIERDATASTALASAIRAAPGTERRRWRRC
jgi:hypothetical protein